MVIATRHNIRQQMRHARNQLSPIQQKQASQAIQRSIKDENMLDEHQHIALYLAYDGELDPQCIIETLWELGKDCYLPIVKDESKQLGFILYEKDTPLSKNQYGIFQPSEGENITAQALDLVFLPLVAFDEQGNRLGMGKGYYDQTFSFLKQHAESKPFLIGLAHELQKVSEIPNQHWDIPLHAIITEKRILECNIGS